VYGSILTADAELEDGTPVDLEVASTVGASPGMAVVVRLNDGSQAAAQIVEVRSRTVLRVVPAADLEATAHEAAVFAQQLAGAAGLTLASGAGLVPGDLLVAVQASGVRRAARVGAARTTGLGMLVTLESAFPNDVPGYEFAARRTRYRARNSTAGTNIPFPFLSFTENPAPSEGAANDRLILVSGLEAPWNSGTNQFESPVDISAGEVWLDAPLVARPYSEPYGVTNPTAAQLAQRFSFVPVGTRLVLVAQDGTETEVTRSAAAPGFTGAIPNATFREVRFDIALDEISAGVLIRCVRAPAVGDFVELAADTLARVTQVEQPSGAPRDVYLLGFEDDLPAGAAESVFTLHAWQPTQFLPLRYSITARLVEGGVETVSELYTGLGLSENHPRYYAADGIINQVSALITVGRRTATAAIDSPDVFPAAVPILQAGANGALTTERIRLAFEALERAAEPSLLACPDALTFQDPDEQGTAFNIMIGHGEKMRRFSAVDLPPIDDDQRLLAWRQKYLDSTHAAAYAPHVRIINPRPRPVDKTIVVPPSGYVLGVFARVDNERGVHKAPANERVRGILGPAVAYTQRRQDLLNPAGINLLRAFPQRGTRIWGARNATTDTDWLYVNVRRLFLYIENAIDTGTQWVVFEPNTDTTWLRVRVSVENFLNQIWRAGGLAGTTPEQAYRVRVGLGVTMTETDVDLGLLIIEVGIAPSKPAEFVVFRISHKRLTE
jgi:hypothetical protein